MLYCRLSRGIINDSIVIDVTIEARQEKESRKVWEVLTWNPLMLDFEPSNLRKSYAMTKKYRL